MAEQMQWISPSSVATKLDGTDTYYYLSLIGRQGIFGSPKTFITQQVPIQHGEKLQRVLVPPTDPRVPLLIKASSESNLIVAIRNLRTQMNALLGDGKLQYTAADGTIRQLTCRLASGLEGDESDGNRGPGFIVAPLIFHASDPFWYDQNTTTATYTTFGSQTITNTGDVECWPVWTIHGPITSLTIANGTTGYSVTTTITLSSSDTLIIDTTPFVKSVTKAGVNEYSTLSTSSSLWSFAVGSNTVNFTIAGNTVATSIGLSYKQRYFGV